MTRSLVGRSREAALERVLAPLVERAAAALVLGAARGERALLELARASQTLIASGSCPGVDRSPVLDLIAVLESIAPEAKP